jgi:hypothetical protein
MAGAAEAVALGLTLWLGAAAASPVGAGVWAPAAPLARQTSAMATVRIRMAAVTTRVGDVAVGMGRYA